MGLFQQFRRNVISDQRSGWRILLVCMGNICRSPMAEGVLRQRAEEAGLATVLHCDSAGTLAAHAGEAPDPRAQQVAGEQGLDISRLRARAVTPDDFQSFDWILAMDRNNLATLLRQCPPQYRIKVQLFLEFAGEGGEEVPDPYYGGIEGFHAVLERCERGAQGVIRRFQAQFTDGKPG